MWLEVNVLVMPFHIFYWSLTLYYLRQNINDMNA